MALKLEHSFCGFFLRSRSCTEKFPEVTVTQFSLVLNLLTYNCFSINRTLSLYFYFIIHTGWGCNTLQHVEGNFLLGISCGECFEFGLLFMRFPIVGGKSFGVGIGFPILSSKGHITPILLLIFKLWKNPIFRVTSCIQLVFFQTILILCDLIQGFFRAIKTFPQAL